MWETRECQAYLQFGVPADSRLSHIEKGSILGPRVYSPLNVREQVGHRHISLK